jgi:hypothetical protein
MEKIKQNKKKMKKLKKHQQREEEKLKDLNLLLSK